MRFIPLGLNNKKAIPRDTYKAEREFIAHYEMIMNKTLPPLSPEYLRFAILSTITDKYSEYGNYYHRMAEPERKNI